MRLDPTIEEIAQESRCLVWREVAAGLSHDRTCVDFVRWRFLLTHRPAPLAVELCRSKVPVGLELPHERVGRAEQSRLDAVLAARLLDRLERMRTPVLDEEELAV